MLLSLKDLRERPVHASDLDRSFGYIDDFYFDDNKWTIRYIVVDSGVLMGRKVLISPISIREVAGGELRVHLTHDQIRNSPPVEEHRPVSRKDERAYGRYYGYPPYWVGTGYWGVAGYPGALARPAAAATETAPDVLTDSDERDSHLRSCNEVLGYHIQATNGEIGHIDDFLVDADVWDIRWLRVDTSNLMGGRAVVLPQDVIRRVLWPERKVYVAQSKEQVQNSIPYDSDMLARTTAQLG